MSYLHTFTLKAQPLAADEIYIASAADSYGERRATITSLLTSQTLTNCTLTNPTMTTPTLGVATATSINKVTITAPASSAVLTIANGKTFTASNTLTFAGTDGTTMTFPGTSASIARIDAAQTFAGTQTFSGTIAAAGITASSLAATGAVTSSGATAGLGYATGAGGAVTQGTSRTTGVTLNTICGAITLFTAAGSATAASFTVTNSAVAATDVIALSVKSSTTNKYVAVVTAVGSGSFEITFYTTGGTTSDAPVFNFAVIKAVAA